MRTPFHLGLTLQRSIRAVSQFHSALPCSPGHVRCHDRSRPSSKTCRAAGAPGNARSGSAARAVPRSPLTLHPTTTTAPCLTPPDPSFSESGKLPSLNTLIGFGPQKSNDPAVAVTMDLDVDVVQFTKRSILQQCSRCAVRKRTWRLHHYDVVSNLCDEIEIVERDDNRTSGIGERTKPATGVEDMAGIEAGSWLIDDEHLRR